MTFEQFLQDKHAEQYLGLDDEMPDDFDEWLCEITVDDWIQYGEQYGMIRMISLSDRIKEKIWKE